MGIASLFVLSGFISFSFRSVYLCLRQSFRDYLALDSYTLHLPRDLTAQTKLTRP